MSVLNYFKNTPGRPPIGRQDLSVIFFFKFATRSMKKKGGLSPPSGDQWAGPPTGAAGACRPLRGRQGGPVAPLGRPG